jgi:tRNA 5-methylaminomethyl-2-thiouridine biosynthesis bifunctional protein
VRTSPIVAANVIFDEAEHAPPSAPLYGDVYHPHQGALEQARHIFLRGSGLPERWRGRTQFTVVETGFGLGNSFLATWQAWLSDAERCEHLHFVSLEKHPLTGRDLQRAHAQSPVRGLADQLVAAWPPLTPNLHVLNFEGGRVRLVLGFGDATVLSREVVAQADAFFLDGFAPARNEAMWSPPLLKALGRLAAPEATAATWSAARTVKDGLAQAGFEVHGTPGGGAKRDITLARYAPRMPAKSAPSRLPMPERPTQALIIGGGLAGAATARALMQRGIACTVIDREPQPAAQASGNPAGLFHGTLSADDGPHARWHRAASFWAARTVREAVARGVPGAADGFLRLENQLDVPAMQALLNAQALPPSYVQALSSDQASEQCGVPLRHNAWLYPEGGWVDPRALVVHWLAKATWIGGVAVERLVKAGTQWRVLDAQGHCIAQAPLVVLANAHDALRLAGLPRNALQSRRGQLSWWKPPPSPVQAEPVEAGPFDKLRANGLAPHIPIASGGYVLRLTDGTVVMGATNQANDADATVRASDHAHNVARAARLLDAAPVPDGAAMHGRVAWRAVARDRLPLIGPAPDTQAPAPRRQGVHLVPRQSGLWLHTGLGSRGITTAALGGELIAAQVLGEPWPLEADLADALDPARVLRLRDEG